MTYDILLTKSSPTNQCIAWFCQNLMYSKNFELFVAILSYSWISMLFKNYIIHIKQSHKHLFILENNLKFFFRQPEIFSKDLIVQPLYSQKCLFPNNISVNKTTLLIHHSFSLAVDFLCIGIEIRNPPFSISSPPILFPNR